MPPTKKRTPSKRRKKKKRKSKRQYEQYFSSITMLTVGLGMVLIIFIMTYGAYDNRVDRINSYFAKYDMPLEGHGKTFVQVADSCNMDWRLLPAIAVRESSGGKHMQYNNPFGWGSAEIPFTDFDDAIRQVGWNLCGFNPNTAQWYGTTSTERKLYYYNGTVLPTYPQEVLWIMDQI